MRHISVPQISWVKVLTYFTAICLLVIGGLVGVLFGQSPRDCCPGDERLVTIEQLDGSFTLLSFGLDDSGPLVDMPMTYKHSVVGYRFAPLDDHQIRLYDNGVLGKPTDLGLLRIPELSDQECSASKEQEISHPDHPRVNTWRVPLLVTVAWVE